MPWILTSLLEGGRFEHPGQYEATKIEHPSATQYTPDDADKLKIHKSAIALCLDAYFLPFSPTGALGKNGLRHGSVWPEPTEHGVYCKIKGV